MPWVEIPRPAPGHSAARLLRLAPELLASGRVRTAPVAEEPARGVIRASAEVVASAEGAAEAGSLIAGRLATFEAREGDRRPREAARAGAVEHDVHRAVGPQVHETRVHLRCDGARFGGIVVALLILVALWAFRQRDVT